jgi:hypothetical protein
MQPLNTVTPYKPTPTNTQRTFGMSRTANRPMASSPRTSHFCVSQLGSQEWLMKREMFPCAEVGASG